MGLKLKTETMFFILCGIIAVLFGYIIITKNTREISELKKRNAELELIDERKGEIIDSAMVVIGKQADSLRIAKNTIRVKHNEWLKLHARTEQTTSDHDKIIYITFTSDSLRWRELSKLYPTISN